MRLKLLFIAIYGVWAMDLTSPTIGTEVLTFVHSTIFNRHIGPQNPEPVRGPVYYTKEESMCALSDDVRGMIVLMDKTGSVLWDLVADVANLQCLSDAGALAAINAYGIIAEPGMGFNLVAPLSNISIPLYHVAIKAIPSLVLNELKQGGPITANLTADFNPWTEMWESKSFKIVWTQVFPAINALGMVASALGTALLARLLFVKDNLAGSLTRVRRFNVRLLITSNIIMVLTCAMRLYYCVNGPMYKSTTRNMAFHFILLNVTIVWEAISSIIAIAIFMRWASFGVPPKERLFNKILAAMAAAGFPLYLVITIVNFLKYVPITAVLQPLLMTLSCVVITMVYLYRTLLFTFRTYQHRHRKGGSYTSRMRIGLLMNIAALMNVVMVVALVMALHPSYFFTVSGRYMVYTVLFFGLSIQALAQILAFMPALNGLPVRKSLGNRSDFHLSGRAGHKHAPSARSAGGSPQFGRSARPNPHVPRSARPSPQVSRRGHPDHSYPVPKVVYPPDVNSPKAAPTVPEVDLEQTSDWTAPDPVPSSDERTQCLLNEPSNDQSSNDSLTPSHDK